MTFSHPVLQDGPNSLAWERFEGAIATTENLLIVQDLDGVCMGLVRDPLTRTLDPAYLRAARSLAGHFYVLTNGEHGGRRGVNAIAAAALGEAAAREGLYLPGLAAGGVQWQDRWGQITYPGTDPAELDVLAAVPARLTGMLRGFFGRILAQQPDLMTPETLDACIAAGVLDNAASPTVNLNGFYDALGAEHLEVYRALQGAIAAFLDQLLDEAAAQGFGDSFFVHYAPNLGRDRRDRERLWLGDERDGQRTAGTTDLQFMLTGAIKEAGVLDLLNRYYRDRTGVAPLGDRFNARNAPRKLDELLDLARDRFDPAHFPLLIGVGDTVTSVWDQSSDPPVIRRGGSDRNFLTLIQRLGEALDRPTIIAYVDSSGGEVKNRRPVLLNETRDRVLGGPGDPRDDSDPLRLDLIFPDGHRQYVHHFCQAAQHRIGPIGPRV
jgi:glucosylglycerol 3-phosphatase